MVASMAGFTIEDSLIKLATRQISLGQVLVVVGVFGMCIFAILARRSGDQIWNPGYLSKKMLWRSSFEVMGRLCYTAALVLVPLTLATAILQATPLFVVAGAAIFLGEKVGWRRWSAIILGFIGVLVILRPGLEGFSPLAILAVLGMLGFAGRDLATRAAPPALSNMQLGVVGFAMLALAGVIVSIYDPRWVMPSTQVLFLLAMIIAVAFFSYQMLTMAMRTGDVSAVTPWRYSRLISAAAAGLFVFGEAPDTATIIGSAMIVASGVFTLKRSQRTTAA